RLGDRIRRIGRLTTTFDDFRERVEPADTYVDEGGKFSYENFFSVTDKASDAPARSGGLVASSEPYPPMRSWRLHLRTQCRVRLLQCRCLPSPLLGGVVALRATRMLTVCAEQVAIAASTAQTVGHQGASQSEMRVTDVCRSKLQSGAGV